MMKWILSLLILLLPVIPTTSNSVIWKQVEQPHTTMESYTTIEQVSEPYTKIVEKAVWQDDGSWDRHKNLVFFSGKESIAASRSVTPGRYVIKQYPIVSSRIVSKQVTRFREVTKTRVVNTPTPVESTNWVSAIQWVLKLVGGE